MLADAYEDGMIDRNPAMGLRIGRGAAPTVDVDDRRALSPQELARLLEAFPSGSGCSSGSSP